MNKVYHDDGSYQFSEYEVKKFEKFEAYLRDNKLNVDYATMLEYVTPYYFNSMTAEEKQFLHSNTIINSNTKNLRWNEGLYNGTFVNISKYGASLKGEAKFERNTKGPSDPRYQYVVIINQVRIANTDSYVGISHKVEAWPPNSGVSVICTTIVDPPSGEYYDFAEFEFPVSQNFGYYMVTPDEFTSPISYINPYN